jgi:hypothetical protein
MKRVFIQSLGIYSVLLSFTGIASAEPSFSVNGLRSQAIHIAVDAETRAYQGTFGPPIDQVILESASAVCKGGGFDGVDQDSIQLEEYQYDMDHDVVEHSDSLFGTKPYYFTNNGTCLSKQLKVAAPLLFTSALSSTATSLAFVARAMLYREGDFRGDQCPLDGEYGGYVSPISLAGSGTFISIAAVSGWHGLNQLKLGIQAHEVPAPHLSPVRSYRVELSNQVVHNLKFKSLRCLIKESNLKKHPQSARLTSELLHEFVDNLDQINFSGNQQEIRDLFDRVKPQKGYAFTQDLGFLSLWGLFKHSGQRVIADHEQKADFPDQGPSTSQPSTSRASTAH